MITHALLLTSAFLLAAAPEEDIQLTPAEQATLAVKASPSLVHVEYTFRYDKGEAPKALGWGERCPNCGSYHGFDVASHIQEERPYEQAGFLVTPNRVIVADLLVHPRFIESVNVAFGNQRVSAKPVGYADRQNAVIMELAEPLKEAKPLTFDAARKEPYFAVTHQKANAVWTTTVKSFSRTASITERNDRFCSAASNCVVVDKQGEALGLSMSGTLPVDDSWKGSPDKWDIITAERKAELLKTLEAGADRSLLHVLLRFRSPKKGGGDRFGYSSRDPEEEEATERHVVGVLMDETTLLVLANLKAKTTARLQRIQVHPSQGEPVNAKFACTFRDYGCFVATLEKPLGQPPALCTRSILDGRDTLLLSADVNIRGEKRVAYYDHVRIPGFETGWRMQIYPEMRGETQSLFLFDRDGRPWAIPVQRRLKVTVQEEWSDRVPTLTPVEYLKAALAGAPKTVDPNNVPVGEADEDRLAWLGVELQALNRELARVNQVSDLTQDGRLGALVTYVYPDSPAATAGIRTGCVLLRLHVQGHPKPLDLDMSRGGYSQMENFPWDRLDEVPAEYLEDVPAPWPSAENPLNRALTDLGIGQKYAAELFQDGKTVMKDLEVVMGPRTYESAARFKSEPLGLTVRDLSYEVRRYFQLKPDEPGIIVSKVEPGGKAAVAGIRPYELITHVDAKAVTGTKDFETAAAGAKDELRLSVKRKTQGREVKIKMTGPPDRKGAGGRLPFRIWSSSTSKPTSTRAAGD